MTYVTCCYDTSQNIWQNVPFHAPNFGKIYPTVDVTQQGVREKGQRSWLHGTTELSKWPVGFTNVSGIFPMELFCWVYSHLPVRPWIHPLLMHWASANVCLPTSSADTTPVLWPDHPTFSHWSFRRATIQSHYNISTPRRMLPVVSDFDLPAATISSYHDIVAARSAVGHSPSPVRWPGTRCLTTSRPVAQCRHFQEEAEDASVLECTWTHSALEALRNTLYK